MSGDIGGEFAATEERSWLYNHIGRILGVMIGLFVVGLLAFFAAIGFEPALYVIVFFLTGLVLIILGGKIHRA